MHWSVPDAAGIKTPTEAADKIQETAAEPPAAGGALGANAAERGGGAPIIQLNNIFPQKKSERVPSQVPPVGLSFFSKKEFAARKIFVINTLKSFLLDRTVSNMSVPVGLRVGFFFHFVTSLT